jgi:serralysin
MTLTGGPGADRFVFNTPLNPKFNVDTITDFTPSQGDKIVLSETDFGGIGALGTLGPVHFHVGAPVNGKPQIDYDPSTGFLVYDANGDHPGGMTHFATLTTHPTIHHGDFIVIA